MAQRSRLAGPGMSKRKRARTSDSFDKTDGATWACQSCTYLNPYDYYKCEICLTRRGTSTRRARASENVVKMQKTVHDMVLKQVEKEKTLRRKERQIISSSTPTSSIADTSSDSLNTNNESSISTPSSAKHTPSATPAPAPLISSQQNMGTSTSTSDLIAVESTSDEPLLKLAFEEEVDTKEDLQSTSMEMKEEDDRMSCETPPPVLSLHNTPQKPSPEKKTKPEQIICDLPPSRRIPDYLINRKEARKIVIDVNGVSAVFYEFPRRLNSMN